MSITTRHTPLPLQLLGAAVLTVVAFATGPAVGALAGGPTFVPLDAPVEAAVDTPAVVPAPPTARLAPASAPVATTVVDAVPSAPREVSDAPALAPSTLPEAARRAEAPTAPRGPTLVSTQAVARATPKRGVGETSATRRVPRGRRCDPTPNPAIVAGSDGAFDVERDLVQSYARSLRKLNSLGWSTPHEGDDGRNDGMLIGGIDCGSDLHLAGLRSGDVVHTVNGRKVTNYAQALMVYQKVKGDRTIEVQLTRRGKPRTLTYRLTG